MPLSYCALNPSPKDRQQVRAVSLELRGANPWHFGQLAHPRRSQARDVRQGTVMEDDVRRHLGAAGDPQPPLAEGVEADQRLLCELAGCRRGPPWSPPRRRRRRAQLELDGKDLLARQQGQTGLGDGQGGLLAVATRDE